MRAPESQRLRPLAVWLLAAVAGALLLAWAFPRAYPFYPERWQVTREEAVAIALERLRDLGELPRDPYVVARMAADPVLVDAMTGLPINDEYYAFAPGPAASDSMRSIILDAEKSSGIAPKPKPAPANRGWVAEGYLA